MNYTNEQLIDMTIKTLPDNCDLEWCEVRTQSSGGGRTIQMHYTYHGIPLGIKWCYFNCDSGLPLIRKLNELVKNNRRLVEGV